MRRLVLVALAAALVASPARAETLAERLVRADSDLRAALAEWNGRTAAIPERVSRAERGRGAGPDAVNARDLGRVRARRRHPRSGRRDPRRRELPARERRARRPTLGPLPLQPVARLRGRRAAVRRPDRPRPRRLPV